MLGIETFSSEENIAHLSELINKQTESEVNAVCQDYITPLFVIANSPDSTQLGKHGFSAGLIQLRSELTFRSAEEYVAYDLLEVKRRCQAI